MFCGGSWLALIGGGALVAERRKWPRLCCCPWFCTSSNETIASPAAGAPGTSNTATCGSVILGPIAQPVFGLPSMAAATGNVSCEKSAEGSTSTSGVLAAGFDCGASEQRISDSTKLPLAGAPSLFRQALVWDGFDPQRGDVGQVHGTMTV